MLSSGRLGQFEEVVGGADHRLFASDLIEPTQEELPEAFGLLDLPKDGLDNLFSQAVAASPASRFRHAAMALIKGVFVSLRRPVAFASPWRARPGAR